MRKAILFALLLLVFATMVVPTGCTDKKPQPADTLAADSTIADTVADDSADEIIAATPMPKAADELFDDFVFNFAANRQLQRKRIVFPLKVYRNGKLAKEMTEKQWHMEHFFMRQQYYTLIFDNERQMKLVKDTSVANVIIEKIFFDRKVVQQFRFGRVNGQWMMQSINYKPIFKNKNADFLKFYERFASDSTFQIESMADEVEFTAPDPNDDFSSINGVMMPQQWPDFKPGLIPKGNIYNIIYGQKYTESNKKIFVIRGIANGLEIELTFRKIDGQWKLVKFNA